MHIVNTLRVRPRPGRAANDSRFNGKPVAFRLDYQLPAAGCCGRVTAIAFSSTQAVHNLSIAFGDQPFGVKVKTL